MMHLLLVAALGLADPSGEPHFAAMEAPRGATIAASRTEDPQLVELKQVEGIPESLIQAVTDELAANPRARLGLSVRVVEPYKLEDQEEPIELVYSFGSYKTLSDRRMAREGAKLRAESELLDEKWERLTPSVEYRQIFKEFNRKAELPASASINSWSGQDDKNWAFTLCVCPVEEIQVEPEEVAAAWTRYLGRLDEEARKAVRSSQWDQARRYLAEYEKRQPLPATGLVTTIWANYFDGKAKGDTASAGAFLTAAEKGKMAPRDLLSFMEFLIVADLDDMALSLLEILQRN